MNEKVYEAFLFAFNAHKNQKRKGTKCGYIIHPLSVFMTLRNYTNDNDILCAALLHDVVEDTKISIKEIEKRFGLSVANIVWEVTSDGNKNFPNLKSQKALMVKLADVLDNISTSISKNYIDLKIDWIKKASFEKRECDNQ